MMIPKDTRQDAIVMEFKVQDGEEEKKRSDIMDLRLKAKKF